VTLNADLIEFIDAEVSLDRTTDIGDDTDLLLTGLVDSLGVIRIVHWLEDGLGITVDPAEVVLDNFQTVRQIVAFAERITEK